MGCGKTTVGKCLARLTRRELVDIDAYIQREKDMTIAEIFAEFGEQGFRDAEHEACKKLGRGKIISTGGGTVLYERNVIELKKNGIIVFIDLDLEVLQRRLKRDTRRPLLQVPNRREVIENLYNQRIEKYRNAADVIVSGDKSIDYTALDILKGTGIL